MTKVTVPLDSEMGYKIQKMSLWCFNQSMVAVKRTKESSHVDVQPLKLRAKRSVFQPI